MNKLLITLSLIVSIGLSLFKAPQPITAMTIEQRADLAGMTVEDFIFISSVVEAESDRSESLEGRVLIALTIINRVEDERFPDTISEVLTQRGQFSTVRNGHSIVDRTDYSDEAVIRAVEWNEQGTEPNVLFFNCRGYNNGTAYGYIDGNYFMTMEEENELYRNHYHGDYMCDSCCYGIYRQGQTEEEGMSDKRMFIIESDKAIYSVCASDEEEAKIIFEDFKDKGERFERIREELSKKSYAFDKMK